MPRPDKTWWAPVWRGLVADPEGKHLRRLDGAVWLFLYLVLHAERRTGIARCTVRTVARSMGAPKRTVQRWLGRLLDLGYVSLEERGRVLVVVISRWKAFGERATNGAVRATVGAKSRHEWRTVAVRDPRNSRYLRDKRSNGEAATESS